MSQKIDGDKNWKIKCGEEFINKKIGSKAEIKEDVHNKILDEFVINHGTRYDGYSGIYGKEINDFITDSKTCCNNTNNKVNCFYCAFYADMEGFKAFNDYLSEKLGDYILVFVANALNSSDDLKDFLITRSGGDEFNGYMISKYCSLRIKEKHEKSYLIESLDDNETEFYNVFNDFLYEELKVQLPQKEFKVHYFKGKSSFRLEAPILKPSCEFSLTEEEKGNNRFHVEFKGLKLRYGYTASQDASREAWKVASEYKEYKKSISAEIVEFIKNQYDIILENICNRKTGSSIIDDDIIDDLVDSSLRNMEKDDENIRCALKLKRIFRELSKIIEDVPEEELEEKCAEYKEIFLKRYDLTRGEFIHSVKVRCGVRVGGSCSKDCSTCYERPICDVCDDWISLNCNIVFVVVEEKSWNLSDSLKKYFESRNQKYTAYLQEETERIITAFRFQIPADKGRSDFLKERCKEIHDAIHEEIIEAKVEKSKMLENIFTLQNFSIQDLQISGPSKKNTLGIIRKALERDLEKAAAN